MCKTTTKAKNHQAESLKILEKDSIVSQFLNSEQVQLLFQLPEKARERIFTPLVTLTLFIKQVLSPDKSCRNAVAGLIKEQSENERKISSGNTGAYCKARKKLSTESIEKLSLLAHETMALEPGALVNKYMNRDIVIADGTTILMADTKANQTTNPQHGNQKEGVGFPISRMVILQSLTTGAVIAHANGAFKGKGTGEHMLLRRIIHNIKKEDIFLGDRYYPSFFHLSEIKSRGADGLYQAQGQRKVDFRKGSKLGTKEHLVEWKKPPKPKQMSDEEYNKFPDTLTVREFCHKGMVYVTTLLDDKIHKARELKNLYKKRWQVELVLRDLKSTLNMDMLNCKTPSMVQKEIAVHFLAYNLIKMHMMQAACLYFKNHIRLSFKGTLQYINQFTPILISAKHKNLRKILSDMYFCIAKEVVPYRPDRIEPREAKRRRKPHKKMQIRREESRKLIKEKQLKLAA